jgi:hypothetical protein
MRMMWLLSVMMLFFLAACSSGLKLVKAGVDLNRGPYVDGMHGVENLAFDGESVLFVTGLDGMLYRIEPTGDPFRGNIAAQKKLGAMCLGIEIGPDGFVYVGVEDENGVRRIGKIDKNFGIISYLTDDIPGLNGFAQSRNYLYYTASNEGIFFPKGKILRVKFGADENFKHPEVVVDKAGVANGLAFSPDETILYYTETLNGVWSFDLEKKVKKQIYNPSGVQVFDDIDTAPDGTLWLCLNSELALGSIRNEIAKIGYRVGDLKAPSSCRFGKGPGFRPDFLYITEFGLKGRSLKMNGRGIWVLPTAGLEL